MAATKPTTNGAQPQSSNTLYCSNLPDKLRKEDLQRALYMLFSVYGPVLDVVCLKTSKMRGQAHVLFRDVSASSQAMRAVQGSEFFGKEMKISYAKSKSDTLAKLDGTYKQPALHVASAAVENQPSSLQQSIFAGPPGTLGTTAPATAPPPAAQPAGDVSSPPAQGVKRQREESDDEKDEAPMDMDDEAMEESDPE